jgi:hypothetical protein
MFPRGESEPVAFPKSGGLSGSPPPDPLSAYVTSIVSASAVIAAKKPSAKAQATAGRNFFEYTLHILSSLVSKHIRTHAAIKVKETGCKACVNS